VRDTIAGALRSGELKPGEQLPSEFVLAERLQVSRSTIREAMKLLQQDGLVEVRRGMGSFASAVAGIEPERPITQFESLTKMMSALGYRASTVVVGVTEREASANELTTLGLKRGSAVVEVRRVREIKGRPWVYSVNVLDPRTLGAPVQSVDWSGSVVSLLDEAGYEIVASSAHIGAVSAPAVEDQAEGVVLPDGPWLMVTEQCVTRDGRCVLSARDYHHASMFTFSVLRRRDENAMPSSHLVDEPRELVSLLETGNSHRA